MFRLLRFLRFLGSAALWVFAAFGVLAGALWLATAAGFVQPLIVISGSMEPTIDTGDLLIATKADTASLEVGDVVSLPSELTDKLVTHRIVSITPLDGDRWEIEMQGDANPTGDVVPYLVGDQVWKPGPRLPGMGTIVSTAMRPSVALPAVIALAALLGFSLLNDDDDDTDDEDEDDDDDVLDDLDDIGGPWPAPIVAAPAGLPPPMPGLVRPSPDTNVVEDRVLETASP